MQFDEESDEETRSILRQMFVAVDYITGKFED